MSHPEKPKIGTTLTTATTKACHPVCGRNSQADPGLKASALPPQKAGSHGQCRSDRGLLCGAPPTHPSVDRVSSKRARVHISYEEPTVRKTLTVATTDCGYPLRRCITRCGTKPLTRLAPADDDAGREPPSPPRGRGLDSQPWLRFSRELRLHVVIPATS
jgi:hypothetical protein